MNRPASLLIAALLAATSASAQPAQAQAPAPLRVTPADRAQLQFSYAPIVKRVTPAVVNVYASRVERRQSNPLMDDPFFQRFFGQRPGGQTARSLGSGVIVDATGLVVTNNHVIEGMTEVRVALSDRREFDAEIVLRDPRTDLAVLRLKNGSNFPFLQTGDSEDLEVGDLVLAIGNPFGVGQTVTQGIVSGLARTQTGISDYGFFIQTDAAINPGNSGGALVDMNGRLVGINSAIYSRTGGSVGIGFAIPSAMVRVVIGSALGGGKTVRRPWFGAALQSLSKDIADSLGLDRPSGALVASIHTGSPAEAAGVRRGDIIVSVDNLAVDDPEAFGFRLGTRKLGESAAVTLLRDGKPVTLNVAMRQAPETPPREEIKLRGRSPFAGATIVNYSPAVAEETGVEGVNEGVVISEIEEHSTAARVNLQKGDVVIAVNDDRIARTKDLEQAATARPRVWRLTIRRAGQVFQTVLGG
ncbi:MAG: DegQ family serine endoprotease [Beijerinckiaceae bacterium]|nr:DegQ family serine endoprotease [Beijerinckiaceae bacterium]